MQISGLKQSNISTLGRFAAIALVSFFLINSSFGQSAAKPTTINITDTASLKTAKRIGIVLGNQDFYDSGQFMRNIAFRNPGFEAEIWQTIFHCEYVTATSCTDDDLYTYWPANFMANGKAEFLVGAATGETATVKSSTAAVIGSTGVTLNFSALATPPAVGDYVVVRLSVPGNAQAGWWFQGSAGTKFTTETSDLSPNTPGKQALRVTQGTSDNGAVVSYMDSVPGRSFLQLNGTYTLSFRAKGTGGSNQVAIAFERAVSAPPAASYFNKTITLSNSWQDYEYTFSAKDIGQVGTLALKFTLPGSSMIIDDVALTAAAASDNPTVYRDEVVSTLRNLKPGILRFMDSGTDWGSTIDNMLQPDFARKRAGYTNHNAEADDIPLNLHDYLVLCQTIGAEPWYTMPTGMSTQEMSDLMDYFGGSTSTVYGARRAALGQTAPWTTVFPKIHLEFGNEVWNTSNPGASMNDALSYGKRAGVIFTTAKNSASYNAKVFDLIQNGFEADSYWTQQALSTSTNYDTVDVAAYIFSNLFDISSTEAIYGPMFAEPEAFNSTSGGIMDVTAQVAAAANPPAKVAIYEENMGTIQGTASQALVNSTVAGVGSGVAMALNMLTMVRDLGITDQNVFALAGLTAPYTPSGGSNATLSPIWGTTIDMGGQTNLLRPVYLAHQLANTAILPTLLTSTQTGANPTWDQPFTKNDDFSLAGAHCLQNFAFTDGDTLNIILFNLSRTTALPVNFAGLNAPVGSATISTLTAPTIGTTNETAQNVTIKTATQTLTANSSMSLPPFSMTVVSVAKPVVPIVITSMKASCAKVSLSPGDSTACTADVVGQGKYDASVNWSVDNGTIDSNGNYVAPATIPANGKAMITVTSAQDNSKKVKITLSIADNTITGVTATCAAASVGQGQTLACTAIVNGTGGFSPDYTWSTTAGSILANGTVTAPTTGTTLTVQATSTQDPTKSDSVTLAVTPVLIMTAPKSLATTSTTTTVAWTSNLAAHGGISYGPTQSLGLSTPYVAAATTNPSFTLTGLKPNTTYYMAVYSFVNGQTATRPFNVTTSTSSSAVTGISVACDSTEVNFGDTVDCDASLTGTGNYSAAVTWSISAGSISTAGLVTAPLTGTSVKVTATSVEDRTKSASVLLQLTAKSTITAVSVSCASSSISVGASTTCTPKVTGTGPFSSAVTWSASAGTITSSGVFTAPATGTSVTVTATSTQDQTKSASAVITLNSVLVISGPAATTTSSTATISWSLNFAAHSGISYGPTSSLGSSTGYVAVPTAKPTFTLTGLKASTTYYLVFYSFIDGQDVSQQMTIQTAAATPTVSSVAVSCGSATVTVGNSLPCTALVHGTGDFSQAVVWSTSAGTITPAGVMTPPATTTAMSAVVTATSTADSTKFASVTVAVTPAIQKLAIVNPTFSATSTTIVLHYNVTEKSHNGASYGPTLHYGATTPYDANLISDPTYTITGLKPGTTYYFLLFSFNDNGYVTTPVSFSTAAK